MKICYKLNLGKYCHVKCTRENYLKLHLSYISKEFQPLSKLPIFPRVGFCILVFHNEAFLQH